LMMLFIRYKSAAVALGNYTLDRGCTYVDDSTSEKLVIGLKTPTNPPKKISPPSGGES
jgi:hypothetical protein